MTSQFSGDRRVTDRPQRVVPVPVGELVALIGGELVGAETTVTGVTLRAQDVRPGDVFAALPGTRTHGARFAADALAAGASVVLTDPAGRELLAELPPGSDPSAVLVHPDPRRALGMLSARIYGDPSRELTMIGITGTSGKTTTAYLVEAALREAGRTVGLIGTVETRIEGQRLPSSLTTPEAPDLQALLAAMVEAGVEAVVMEVSSHALDLGRADGVHFEVAAFTNLSRDHLDYHLTMESYFAAKARLFQAGSPLRARRSVICVDDDWGRKISEIASAASDSPVITVSSEGGVADWAAGEPTTAADGSQQLDIVDPAGRAHRLRLPLPGRYNVANALVALAVVDAIGGPIDVAIAGIGKVAVPGRLQRIDAGQDFLAVVDYAHKPAAVAAVLATLRGRLTGRIAVVLGAGGDRDRAKREMMGKAAALGAELVVITDDNPRSEPPAEIRAAVRRGADEVPVADRPAGAEPVVEVADRAAAIAAAVEWARSGDVVLVAGKGHETGQEIDGVIHPFDDRSVLAQALDVRAGKRS